VVARSFVSYRFRDKGKSLFDGDVGYDSGGGDAHELTATGIKELFRNEHRVWCSHDTWDNTDPGFRDFGLV
jgi:hypothetical protein